MMLNMSDFDLNKNQFKGFEPKWFAAVDLNGNIREVLKCNRYHRSGKDIVRGTILTVGESVWVYGIGDTQTEAISEAFENAQEYRQR